MEVDRLPFAVVRLVPGRFLAPAREVSVAWEASAREGPDGSTRWEARRRGPGAAAPPIPLEAAWTGWVPPAPPRPASPPDVEGSTLEAVLEGALELEARAAGLDPADPRQLSLLRAELD